MQRAEPIPAAINEISDKWWMQLLRSIENLGRDYSNQSTKRVSAMNSHCGSISFRSQVALPLTYKNLRLEAGLRLDLLVAESVIVELKSVQRIEPVFEAQLLSYLKLTGFRVGLLINFNAPTLKDGIYRFIV